MPAALEKKTGSFRSILMTAVNDFRRGFLGWRNSIKEDKFPISKNGSPDLALYTEPLEHYIHLYDRFLEINRKGNKADQDEREIVWSLRVHGQWGMIAKGAASIPHALKLLGNPNPDAREDGASILTAVGKDANNASSLVAALKAETDDTARTAIIEALGGCRSRGSIPALAEIIHSKAVDEETRHTAICSLGKIIGSDLEKQPDPVKSAAEWLKQHDHQ